jgi:hypothetical protein
VRSDRSWPGSGRPAVTLTAGLRELRELKASVGGGSGSCENQAAGGGGRSGDGWSGNVTGSGSRVVTETIAGAYTYGLSCTAGSQSAKASAAVQVNQPPSRGGAFDLLTLLALSLACLGANFKCAIIDQS